MAFSKKAVFIASGILVAFLTGIFAQQFVKKQIDSQSFAAPIKSGGQNPVSKCYQSFYDEPKEIWSVAQDKYTYYQILARPKKSKANDDTFVKLYFRVNNYRCEFLNPGGSGGSRLSFMPKSVAIRFAEEWFKPAFENCIKSKSNTNTKLARQTCIKEFEAHINVPPNTKEVSPAFLFTEDAIALNKLGIRTDKALVVDTYADFEKYMSKFRGKSSQPKK